MRRADHPYEERDDEGKEISWNQIRECRHFLKEKTGKWIEILSGDTRRLEREERNIRNEMLMIRKGKFGKISGKKLTVTEDVIL